MQDVILDFQDVSYRYAADEGETPLPLCVRHVNLQIERGSFTAILGHNGSGKSTLAKLSNSILVPESGRVLVNGMDTSDEDLAYDIRRTVGVVFQNPDNQIVASIVEEDVAFGPENLGVAPAEIRKRVDDALKAVGMYEYRGHEPHKLSGGQKQRVAIAGMIAMLPEALVLDEPTAMLDPQGRKEVLETIHRLHRERGMTVVLITHFMEEAVDVDRVLVMDDGAILLDGTPADVFAKADLLHKAGLELPRAAKLAADLRAAGAPLPEHLLTAQALSDALYDLLGEKTHANP
ncbi:MAG TPA: energy-coupling factor transporter ATPase [Candidatus Fimenecus excrementigallinarum]|uniref:Energy-coupling factor transporter ATPase n=1 Tax=Candidatus Fimenecus excrementigallinarum TaxID=2840816 RepID=A0A9D1ID56_9FIRM|nr:energy-coupling factor transporter ATPase [Candidatus Fimenecus excrementigallinarum]